MSIQKIHSALSGAGFSGSPSFEGLALKTWPQRLRLAPQFAHSLGSRGPVKPIVATKKEIVEIPDEGLVITEPGTYILSQDITWTPKEAGAAITIAANDVTIDLNNHTLSIQLPPVAEFPTTGIAINKLAHSANGAHLDIVDAALRGESLCDFLYLAGELVSLVATSVTILNGKIEGASGYGVTALLTEGLSIRKLNVADTGRTSLDNLNGCVVGIAVALSVGPTLCDCQINQIQGLCELVFGILFVGCVEATAIYCTVQDLHNYDGVATGHAATLTAGLNLIDCHAKNLRSNFLGFSNAPGRTVLGFCPTHVTGILSENCSAQDIYGSSDDCHGMSLYLVNEAAVTGFEATNVIDGNQTNTGAKATGLEVYGDNIVLKSVVIKRIEAICPQDLQAAGISLWGENHLIEDCAVFNVVVRDASLAPSAKVGLGIGFGWAPDPRGELAARGAKNVTYTACLATACQVGFDSWRHQNAEWLACETFECEIAGLVQPVDATRVLVMNRASESPTGMPVQKTIRNDRTHIEIMELFPSELPNGLAEVFDFHQTSVAFPPRHTTHIGDVPGISLPGLYSMAPQFDSEWWYYVGTVTSETGQTFSVQVEIIRNTVETGQLIPQNLNGSAIGIGWRETSSDGSKDNYLFAQGYGFGAARRAEITDSKVSFALPYAQNNSFSAFFKPEIQITDPSKQSPKLAGAANAYISMDYTGAGNAAQVGTMPPKVGQQGATYILRSSGAGFLRSQSTSDGTPPANSSGANFNLALRLRDTRGAVMEGDNGYVGPGMFGKISTSFHNLSYECAQPRLEIESGWIEVGDASHQITEGTLWMDRQMIHAEKEASHQIRSPLTLSKVEGIISALSHVGAAQPLYCGNWIALTFDSGYSMALAVFWKQKAKQWQSGSALGCGPIAGFGNLYLPRGMDLGDRSDPIAPWRLQPKIGSDMWDFDINILDTKHPDDSPHWTSDVTGITYASAWQIAFSSDLNVPGFPSEVILKADVANCENVLPGQLSSFYEGAATLFAADGSTRLGQAFVEQMGFN
ncbi:hypothetical protein GN278_01290 [Rhodobacteraceae bacterium Araon29]